jgi:regulator of RNase E activity RraA
MLNKYAAIKNQLYVAVIADVLDELGYRNQVMPPAIRPLIEDTILIGRARTMLAIPEFQEPDPPFQTQIDATDALEPGDVVVAYTSEVQTCAFWGELFSVAAQARGCQGAVIDGYIRDTRKVIELGFSLFSKGILPVNSKGRLTVSAFDVPITCGGVLVHSGDIVFAEFDGIAVIPTQIAAQVLEQAAEIALKEDNMRQALQNGSTLRDAWEKFRVL